MAQIQGVRRTGPGGHGLSILRSGYVRGSRGGEMWMGLRSIRWQTSQHRRLDACDSEKNEGHCWCLSWAADRPTLPESWGSSTSPSVASPCMINLTPGTVFQNPMTWHNHLSSRASDWPPSHPLPSHQNCFPACGLVCAHPKCLPFASSRSKNRPSRPAGECPRPHQDASGSPSGKEPGTCPSVCRSPIPLLLYLGHSGSYPLTAHGSDRHRNSWRTDLLFLHSLSVFPLPVPPRTYGIP